MSDTRLRRVATALVALAAGAYLAQSLIAVLVRYRGFLLILLLGWLLAFVLNPLINWLHCPRVARASGSPAGMSPPRRLMPRGLAVAAVYVAGGLLSALIVVLFMPTVVTQLGQLLASLPRVLQGLYTVADRVEHDLQLAGWSVPISQQLQTGIGDQLSSVMHTGLFALVSTLGSIAGFVSLVVTAVVLALFLNLGGPRLAARAVRLVPRQYRDEARVVTYYVGRAFAGFIRGQALFAAITAGLTLVVMALFGLPFALGVAFVAFLLALIPLVGAFLAIVPPVLVALIDSPQQALVVLVVLGVAQLILTNLLMPKITGGIQSLEPAVVLVALVLGIQVAGVWGALLALPAAALVQSLGGIFLYGRPRRPGRLRPARVRSAAARSRPPEA